MSDRHLYKSDLSDERWALIEPVIASWKTQHPSVSGHQGAYEMREIVNALFYQSRTGCQWGYLSHGLPPVDAVKYYFYKWRDDGTDQTIHDLPRWQVRESRGRKADPSLCPPTPPEGTRQKVPGRKRGLAVDVLGLVIAVVVLAASIAELAAQLEEFDRVAEEVRITRKILLALPDPSPPTPPAAKLPDHPAYRQIMAVFAAADAPLRARAVCEAMDLEIAPSNVNNVRLKFTRGRDRARAGSVHPATAIGTRRGHHQPDSPSCKREKAARHLGPLKPWSTSAQRWVARCFCNWAWRNW
ncbi:transposase [Streptomyces sp. HUAS TT11]|uniref:transposase n=1 Tax=Streptomyces sp. HUAS TT11 TaxID=3447508 RepID=UPI003F65F8F3